MSEESTTTVELSKEEKETLFNQQINDKADHLTAIHKVKVHPIVFREAIDSEPIVGYIKEPSRQAKLAVMDKSMVNPFSASQEIVDYFLIKEESDKRIWDENPDNDKYYIGACKVAFDMVTLSINQFKKK